MNNREIEQYKTITQEFFKKQYNSIKDLGNRELRKVIENSNWNFILQIIRHLENEIFILEQKVNQLETNRDEAIEYILNHELVSNVEYNLYHQDIVELLGILNRGRE